MTRAALKLSSLCLFAAALLPLACTISTSDGDPTGGTAGVGMGGTGGASGGTGGASGGTGGASGGTGGASGGTGGASGGTGGASGGTGGASGGSGGASGGTGGASGGTGGAEAVTCNPGNVTPATLDFSCQPGQGMETDPDVGCQACIAAKCCTLFEQCNGSNPRTPCGWGGPDGKGEADCIQACILADGNSDDLQFMLCKAQCATPSCQAPDPRTDEFIDCARQPLNCLAQCFQP